MAQGNPQPRVLRRREGIQLSYDFPQTIYTTKVYPRQSQNGSTVIIYAHDQGISVVWYGGRGFKSPRQSTTNGESIDLTDDAPEELPEFEDEPPELDAQRPFQNVLQQSNIPLGAGVTRLALLPLSADRRAASYPPLLESHIIIGAACVDQTLRIIALPLQPQSQSIKNVQIIKLSTASAHQDLVSDIAITLTADICKEDEESKRIRSRSRGRAREEDTNLAQGERQWSLLIASISPTGPGLLLVHQIPISDDGISSDPGEHMLVHRRFLRLPLASCSLDFNPSPFPAERHSHLLIAACDASLVQVYDTMSYAGSRKRRRGSATTIESNSSATKNVQQASLGGRSLITLLPGFVSNQTAGQLPRRKRVLDAKWIMQGRAIIVLLEDGEWGVWDLEAVAPVVPEKSNNLVKGQSNTSGIHGGSLTRYALRGIVGTPAVVRKKASAVTKARVTTELAPMTPHTRKIRSSELFQGEEQDEVALQEYGYVSGSISTSHHDLATGGPSKSQDESIVLSYGSTSVLIPSIQIYWRSETSGKPSFDTSRLTVLPPILTAAEQQLTTHLLPGVGAATTASSTPPFMVSTRSRLVLLVPPLVQDSYMGLAPSLLPMRLLSAKSGNPDQTLLASGELDIDGMDRILDNMAQGSAAQSLVLSKLGGKKVDFDMGGDEEDEDVDMNTPTVPRSAKSKLTITKGAVNGRRLFT